MKSEQFNRGISKTILSIVAIFGAATLVAASTQSRLRTPNSKAFDSPDSAAHALAQAAATYNVAALLEILGPDAKDLIASDDTVEDRSKSLKFGALAQEKLSITTKGKPPARAEISVGNDQFPLAIPLVKVKGMWYFDTRAGRQEMLFRRIGENELDAIRICRGFVEAQQEYALTRHGDHLMAQYAQKIISSPGTHDGLAWQNQDGTWGGPVGDTVAKAIQEGYAPGATPYHGYYFKVLKGQGPAAPLGAMDFVVKGAMIGGFALAAAPAQYRVTGVQTFMVSSDGVVYQKDLGPNTPSLFKAMELFNPDKMWRPVNDEP